MRGEIGAVALERRAADLPAWPVSVRFVFAPVVTQWQGMSLTRILAAVFALLPFVRAVGFNDVLLAFVVLGAVVAKDNFGNFERIGKLLPRLGRRNSDAVVRAADETADLAERTKDAAAGVVAAVESAPPPKPPELL